MASPTTSTVLLTGCSSGFGRASADRFLAPVSYTHLTLPTNREV